MLNKNDGFFLDPNNEFGHFQGRRALIYHGCAKNGTIVKIDAEQTPKLARMKCRFLDTDASSVVLFYNEPQRVGNWTVLMDGEPLLKVSGEAYVVGVHEIDSERRDALTVGDKTVEVVSLAPTGLLAALTHIVTGPPNIDAVKYSA